MQPTELTDLEIKHIFESLRECHNCFRAAAPPNYQLMSDKTRNLRVNLITEEYGETAKALREANLVDFVDGLADSLYVLAGTFVAAGVDKATHTCEFFCDTFRGALVGYGRGDRVMDLEGPMEFTNPQFREKLAKQFDDRNAAYIRRFDELFSVYSTDPNDIIDRMNVLFRLSHSIGALATSLGVQRLFFPAFIEVHRSNMSKLTNTRKEADDTAYIEYSETGRECEVFEAMPGRYAILRKDDGKFIKPASYSPANIKQLLIDTGFIDGES